MAYSTLFRSITDSLKAPRFQKMATAHPWIVLPALVVGAWTGEPYAEKAFFHKVPPIPAPGPAPSPSPTPDMQNNGGASQTRRRVNPFNNNAYGVISVHPVPIPTPAPRPTPVPIPIPVPPRRVIVVPQVPYHRGGPPVTYHPAPSYLPAPRPTPFYPPPRPTICCAPPRPMPGPFQNPFHSGPGRVFGGFHFGRR